MLRMRSTFAPRRAHKPRYMVRTTISATATDGLETMRTPPRQAAE
jgi:hypothetical protein